MNPFIFAQPQANNQKHTVSIQSIPYILSISFWGCFFVFAPGRRIASSPARAVCLLNPSLPSKTEVKIIILLFQIPALSGDGLCVQVHLKLSGDVQEIDFASRSQFAKFLI